MAILVPIASLSAKSTQTVVLETQVYRLDFEYNTRCLSWYMSISEQDGTPIITASRLAHGIDHIGNHKDPRLPGGSLVSLFITNKTSSPNRIELGGDFRLMYITKDERG